MRRSGEETSSVPQKKSCMKEVKQEINWMNVPKLNYQKIMWKHLRKSDKTTPDDNKETYEYSHNCQTRGCQDWDRCQECQEWNRLDSELAFRDPYVSFKTEARLHGSKFRIIRDISEFFKELAPFVRCVDWSQVITSHEPHYGQVLARERDTNPNRDYDQRLRPFFDYSNLPIEMRKLRWKDESGFVINHNEKRFWVEEYIRLDVEISEIKILKDRWCYDFECEEEIKIRSLQRATRYLELTKEELKKTYEDPQSPIVIPRELEKYQDQQVYIPPKRRIRITTNISWIYEGYRPKVFVYSDIPSETPENIEIPESLCFDYIHNNIVDRVSEPLLAEAVKISNEDDNHIKCGCMPGVDSCFENPECPCYRMNIALRKMNNVKENDQTVFCTTAPIFYIEHVPDFYEHAAFACSIDCRCIGNCNNNVLKAATKSLFHMEIFRKELNIGFGVRATSYIPAGAPVLEFCGEVIKTGRLYEELKSYSMQLTDFKNDRNLLNVINEESGFPQPYLNKLNHLYRVTEWHIDAKWQGNLSRFLMNSCTPNLEPVRVFQKSFTPAHAKILFFSVKSICPGEPLSFDYGPTYFQNGKEKFVCQCGSFACKNGPDASIFSKMGPHQLAACFEKLHIGALDCYKAVMDEAKTRENGIEGFKDNLLITRVDDFIVRECCKEIHKREGCPQGCKCQK